MAHRITLKTLDNLARILSITLGRPPAQWKDGQSQIGNISVDSTIYGYAIERTIEGGGAITRLSDSLSAKECYAWLQGALQACREAGIDGPIAERWTGACVRTNGIAVLVRYMGQTNCKGSRWQAKDRERGTVYGSFTDGPIAAAIKWAVKAELSNTVPRYVMALSPDLYAVEF
jgi:hypothetical protein